ncbi:hypothetical protein [Dermatobacter hominis]|uniref:hypothetical protein n=1 Tax=Dermatobacter hominis TaxID=2884263 RepID=UPI001D0F5A0D|nr:hypothetical protein [Dermatobacter hominis]UDY34037.1 hypothetical protein LH044_11845 [Dermatobacter hominis]
MATDWNEVGERFGALGRTLQGSWSTTRDDAGPSEDEQEAATEVRGALDKVNASLDDLADAITRTVNDPDVHRAATSAAGGLVEALGASLDDLAGRIQSRGSRRDETAPGSDDGEQV